MYLDLGGKTAIVTGSGKRTGIGFAVVEKLASCGVNVVITDLGLDAGEAGGIRTGTRAEMDEIAAELANRYPVETLAINLDVTDRKQIAAMVNQVVSSFGNIDILVNNAGATFGVPNAVHTYDDEAWQKTLDVCLNSVFWVSKAVAPSLRTPGGVIVNVASRAGKFPAIFNGAYSVAKAGVIMMTKVMAKEMAGMGIRVNAICPGQISTDLEKWRFGLEAELLGGTPESREREMCATIPLGRIGTPSEAASLVAYLASREASYITGQAVNITGGQLMEL